MVDFTYWIPIIMHAAVGFISIVTLVSLAYPSLLPNFLFESNQPKVPRKRSRRSRKNGLKEVPKSFILGLVNTGNTCFLNSVLQALSSSSYLLKYIKSSPIITKRIDNLQLDFERDDFPVTEALYSTFNVLTKLVDEPSSTYPTEVVASLRDKMRITTYEQQDAQEFFQILSDSLNEEDNIVMQACRSSPLLDVDIIKSLVSEKDKEDKISFKFSSLQRKDPLSGLLASRLSCVQCGYTAAIRHFAFNNISLSLPFRNSCTLEECLLSYVTIESLQDVVCRKCSLSATLTKMIQSTQQINKSNKNLIENRHERVKGLKRNPNLLKNIQEVTDALKYDVERALSKDIKLEKVVSRHCTKQVMFAKLPPVLCLHLNRSAYFPNGSVTKNMCHVKFPEILDLSPFSTTGHLVMGPQSPLSIPIQTTSHTLYRLQAVIVHYGSHSYGHFVTFRRKPLISLENLSGQKDSKIDLLNETTLENWFGSSSKEWFQVSDQSVLEADILDVLGANPYMLLYEKIPQIFPSESESTVPSLSSTKNANATDNAGSSFSVALQNHLFPSPSPSTSSSGPPTPSETNNPENDILANGLPLSNSEARSSSSSSVSTSVGFGGEMDLVD